VSQIATGEENALRVRVYASKGAVIWQQDNPNYLELYRHGEPRQTLSRGRTEYLSSEAGAATRIPWGHPEGYLEAFANVYLRAIHAIRRPVDGAPVARSIFPRRRGHPRESRGGILRDISRPLPTSTSARSTRSGDTSMARRC